MAETTIRRWPLAKDAIDWSHEGILAIASDEYVHLLIPHLGLEDYETPPWTTVQLQTAWFNQEELQIKEPSTNSIWSIGEEISSSTPVSIKWSAPGVSRHMRCALAVLTTNLTLSIWATHLKIDSPGAAERCLVINHSLTKYFETAAEDDTSWGKNKQEKLRIRSRIRAFAWAPSMHQQGLPATVGTQLEWGQPMIAVSNDCNEIVVVALRSPYCTRSTGEAWDAHVLQHFSIKSASTLQGGNPNTLNFDEVMQQQRYVSHLAWSPWVQGSNGSLTSIIAYATNTHVHGCFIDYASEKIIIRQTFVYREISLQHSGPMKWVPEVQADGTMLLTLFHQEGLTCLTINAATGEVMEEASHNLDGRLDEISGVAFDTRTPSNPRIHISSLLTTVHEPTSVLQHSKSGLEKMENPNWRDQISNQQAYFSLKHNLRGNAIAKVWGLASSPMNDYMASCYTLHPTDMMEYLTSSEKTCTVFVSRSGGRDLTFVKKNISAEAILYSGKLWLEDHMDVDEDIFSGTAKIRKELLATYKSVDVANTEYQALLEAENEGHNPEALIRAFRQTIFLEERTLRNRYAVLLSKLHEPTTADAKETAQRVKDWIALRVAREILELPQSLSSTPFSKKILTSVARVTSALGKTDSTGALEGTTTTDTAVCEKCEVCGANIKTTSFGEARCDQGHVFQRCGLTFLAIQEPWVSKWCGICGRQYYNDEYIADRQEDGEDEAEESSIVPQNNIQELDAGIAEIENTKSGNGETRTDANGRVGNKKLQLTLAKVLYAACDTCIYCGGKFVG